jgi:hypothetical protein
MKGPSSIVAWIQLFALFLVATFSAAQAQPRIDTLLQSGPTAKRINIVVLSEGYTAAELGRFPADALGAVNHLLGQAPYQAYRSFFNAFAISVASAQSGSDHPSRGAYRDTYFNSTYESYGITYLVTIPPNDRNGVSADGVGKVDALLREFMPEYDVVLLLVNDSDYGGSGGRVAVTSLNASAREIAVHELGHSFGGLGDEYDTAYPGYPDVEEPNTTRTTNRASIKWAPWILASTPIPTPEITGYSKLVGLFEGAHYHATGWYRPKLDCKMNHLNVPFCEVCSEALVLASYRLVDPIESVIPGTSQITLSNAPVTLSAGVLNPISTPAVLQWSVNGAGRVGATNAAFTIEPGSLPVGTNVVQVVVRDPTDLVRSDPSKLLWGTHAWNVVVKAPLPEFRLANPAVDPAGAFRLSVPITGSQRVVLEASADGTTWRAVHTNLGSAAFSYTNRLIPAPPWRWFRARSEP